MAQWAGSPEIAYRGMFAFDIARYQWNAEGLTPESANQGLGRLRRELGDQRFQVLQAASRDFHRLLAEVVREANAVGLFRPGIWAEKIEPNLRNGTVSRRDVRESAESKFAVARRFEEAERAP